METGTDGGLSAQEAANRLARDGPNALPAAERRPFRAILLDSLRQPMFLLLLVGGLLYLLLGDRREGILLFSFVLLTLGLALYQDGKAEHALQALRELASPRAAVIRDGAETIVDSRDVVRGDLCVLREGDRVPADGVLEAAVEVETDESMLTGESEPVRKTAQAHAAPSPEARADAGAAPRIASNPKPGGRPGGHDQPFVYAGTTLVQGHGVMRVTAIGADSEMGRVGAALRDLAPGQTPLERQVGKLIKLFGLAGGALSVLLVAWYIASGGAWMDAVLAGIALALSLLPEEFAVILTVFPALGAWRLSRANVLTRRLSAIETLGTTSILCVDKTGTLTENRMSVAALYVGGTLLQVDESTESLPEPYHPLLEYALLASPQDSAEPMDKAVQRLGQRTLRATEHLHPAWQEAREYGLTASLRAVSHAWVGSPGESAAVAAKGAPEAVVDLCHLDQGRRDEVLEAADRLAADGLRVLGVATARFAGPPWPPKAHDFDFALLGLLGFADPLRPGIPAATRECLDAGIRVVMITGDYPATARHIARQAGIGDSEPVTGDELETLDPLILAASLERTTICARVAPQQKLAIVQSLRAAGEIVTMTGDGVNDAPALRAAHVGVAMGKRGTEVARQAASLVLLDDQFASIVAAVRLGRHIFENMRKAMAYVVSAHVPTAGMALLPVLLGWPIFLYPIHIVFLELLIAPTCALAFENEPPEPDLMRKGPRDPNAPLLGVAPLAFGLAQGVVVLATVLATYGWALRTLPLPQARAFAFTTLIVADIGLIFSNRSTTRTSIESMVTPNPLVWLVTSCACAVLALALFVPLLAELFYFKAPAPVFLGLACVIGAASMLWFDSAKLVHRAVRTWRRAST
jgi:Ca2+-transporting ATPase